MIFRDSSEGVTFAVRVMPRAKQNQILGVEGDFVKIRLAAPPIEGRANDALIEFLSETFDIRRSDVEIVRGAKLRRKVIRLRGMKSSQVAEDLREAQQQKPRP
jgi:uncharacterized protein (TIGR00251 family)